MQREHQVSMPEKRRFCVTCLLLVARAYLSRGSRRLAWGGVLMVPAFWGLDALIDVHLFNRGEELQHGLFDLEPVELYMRILVSVLFIGFGMYAAILLDRAERAGHALQRSNAELEGLRQELERLAVADPLTGTFNRRKFHQVLDRAVSNAERHDHRFALLMIDIDHFKSINDTYGHQTGDEVLRSVSAQMAKTVRSADQLFRIGGEEFCLLANVAAEEDIWPLAEKLRTAIAAYSLPGVGRVTASIGVAYFREGDTQESIYARADDAMYEAKRKGRNCVAQASFESPDGACELPA